MSDLPTLRLADGREVPVPPEGALGLLALGYEGLVLWREARRRAAEAAAAEAAPTTTDSDPAP